MKIGILGGGQLGRMLIQDALKYDDEWFTLDPSEDAPCSKISDFTQGSFDDYDTVFDLIKKPIRAFIKKALRSFSRAFFMTKLFY